MEAATDKKNERINLRLKRSAKKLIERAAGLEGKTISHFILTGALDRAEKTVREHETMALNLKDANTFFEALAGPIDFNSKLTEALEEHKRRVVSK